MARFDLSLSDNQRRFLAALIRQPGARRHELAEALGFSPQTAMRVVSPLVEAGILVEIDEVTGARGKPPRLVHFAQSALLTLAFVIAPLRVTVSIADLQGHGLMRETERREFTGAAEQLASAKAITARLLRRAPTHGKIASAAVTASGYFLTRGRRVVSRIDPEGWAATDLRAWVEDLAGVPAALQNDGQVAATSILQSAPYQNFLCVYLDAGIGGAIVENGRVLQGKHGNAGAVGRLFPQGAARPTEKSLRRALSLHNWDAWPGMGALSARQAQALEAWLGTAAGQFNAAMAAALPLLDFEAVYIAARIPGEVLDQLAARIRFQPLGSNLTAPGHVTLPAPKVHAHPIEDMVDMTHTLAARSFLMPPDTQAPERRAKGSDHGAR